MVNVASVVAEGAAHMEVDSGLSGGGKEPQRKQSSLRNGGPVSRE